MYNYRMNRYSGELTGLIQQEALENCELREEKRFRQLYNSHYGELFSWNLFFEFFLHIDYNENLELSTTNLNGL